MMKKKYMAPRTEQHTIHTEALMLTMSVSSESVSEQYSDGHSSVFEDEEE